VNKVWGATGAGMAANVVPGVLSSGQWVPVRALPANLCRWREPSDGFVALERLVGAGGSSG
jgi:hypothetical protein